MKKQNWFLKTFLAGALCFPLAMASTPVNAVEGTPILLKDKHSEVFESKYGFSPHFIQGQTTVSYEGFTDNTRPETRKVVLERNDGWKQEVIIDKDKGWKTVIEDLELENEIGEQYSYTLSVEGIEKYEDTVKGSFNNFKLVSTYRRPEVPKEPEKPKKPTEKPKPQPKDMETGVDPNFVVMLVGLVALALLVPLVIDMERHRRHTSKKD